MMLLLLLFLILSLLLMLLLLLPMLVLVMVLVLVSFNVLRQQHVAGRRKRRQTNPPTDDSQCGCFHSSSQLSPELFSYFLSSWLAVCVSRLPTHQIQPAISFVLPSPSPCHRCPCLFGNPLRLRQHLLQLGDNR